jgi:haloacetate dehalogenase
VFEGFQDHRIQTGDAEIFTLTGGSGPPLLLLHGFPQTHVMWHAVAARLAQRFSLVIPDLRGYGNSRGPAPDAAHRHYSKRVMGRDMIEVMTLLGHERFFVAGHDRGARVAYRLALDSPNAVGRLAVLDIAPTLDMWDGMNRDQGLGSYHWLFLAQPPPLPERLIGRDPDFYLHHLLDRWAGRPDALHPAAVAHYQRHFRKQSVIQAVCEDYRAGATVDLEDDRIDRKRGRRVSCPTLLVWGRAYLQAKVGSPIDVWRLWAADVREVPLECGHFVAEERPEECAEALEKFFSEGSA